MGKETCIPYDANRGATIRLWSYMLLAFDINAASGAAIPWTEVLSHFEAFPSSIHLLSPPRIQFFYLVHVQKGKAGHQSMSPS